LYGSTQIAHCGFTSGFTSGSGFALEVGKATIVFTGTVFLITRFLGLSICALPSAGKRIQILARIMKNIDDLNCDSAYYHVCIEYEKSLETCNYYISF
jgi:hypothetical protein